jgi:hypothetical protein
LFNQNYDAGLIDVYACVSKSNAQIEIGIDGRLKDNRARVMSKQRRRWKVLFSFITKTQHESLMNDILLSFKEKRINRWMDGWKGKGKVFSA